MLNPNIILAGKTYEVLCGDELKTVHISKRTGFSPESYSWHGTAVKTGERIKIANAARFVNEVPTNEFDPPWFISFDIVEQSFENGKLQVLLLSIRERDTHRLVGDLPDIPVEVLPSCAEVIRNAIRFCRSGPEGSDIDKLYFFDDENKILLSDTVDLSFELWDPAFAGEDYCTALFRWIEAIHENRQKSYGVKDDFLPNDDGLGAVYWTEKTGIVQVLWPDGIFLKSLYLQSEEDIRDFAEGLFGEYEHPFETIRKLLDAHEGEWFDPPENSELLVSYKAIQFSSLFLGVLPKVFQSDEKEGEKYFGRIVYSENKADCPDILTWTPIENKIWLRTNDGEDREYFGPFENPTQAAIEVYRRFFQRE